VLLFCLAECMYHFIRRNIQFVMLFVELRISGVYLALHQTFVMKRIFLFALLMTCCVHAINAQQSKPKVPAMPDMNELMKMTPEEREKYAEKMKKQYTQQAAELSEQLNVSFDASAIPGAMVQLPAKDLKRLAALPSTPPTRQQMLANVAKMEAALKSAVDPKLVMEVEKFDAAASIEEIQRASVGGWYGNNPQAAMLLNMKAVRKAPDDITSWNNLAVQYTMTKMEDAAIPILQNLLMEKPNSSILLNNLGQAFLSLGELSKANQYLQKCLEIDELHPEANRAMGMIKTITNDLAAAARYFEKEFHIAQRRSSLTQFRKNAEAKKINLAALRRRKMALDGTDNKNFFEEIHLGKFRIPDLPTNSVEAATWHDRHAGFMKSIQEEMLFWMSVGNLTPEQNIEEGKKNPGLYQDQADILLSELGDDFENRLGLVREDDVPMLEAMISAYYKKFNEVQCPQPPNDRPAGADVIAAYQRKCCDMKKPITDAFVAEYNAFITSRIQVVQASWKEYINGMIGIAQLDPSPGNKLMVYRTVSQYFVFLANCVQAAQFITPPMECFDLKVTATEADGIIQSKRDYDIKCPDWLKVNFSVKVAKIKADCQAFNVEADVYKMINVGMTKTFKTGSTTLYVGAGVDGKFYKDVLSSKLSQQFYIVFDNNNQFADLGMRGTGSFNIASGMFGETFTYDFSMSAGFNSNLTATSDWVKKVQQAMGAL
jgi:Tfp pilus assembly protein PilF